MSVASAFLTDRRALLFAWLFGQPTRSFHLGELRRLTGLGSASVQSELNRLTDAGLLVSERVGRRCRPPRSRPTSRLAGR